MASKTICSVPSGWTMDDYARHTCFDLSHRHLSYAQVQRHEEKDAVEWLRRGLTRREKSVVVIEILPEVPPRDDSWAGRPLATYAMAGEPMNSGLSFRLGAYLAMRVRQNHSWAVVMLSEIKRRPERETALLATLAEIYGFEEGAIECLPS